MKTTKELENEALDALAVLIAKGQLEVNYKLNPRQEAIKALADLIFYEEVRREQR